MISNLISFPAYALLIVEEGLKEQRAEGLRMSEGIQLDELALRIPDYCQSCRAGRVLTVTHHFHG
jgi:hypothetical protein